jgi:hypothetical protein
MCVTFCLAVSGLSEELQYVTLSAIPNEECVAVYGNQISDHMVCVAGDYNEGTCSVRLENNENPNFY